MVLVGCGESDHQHSHNHGHSHAESDGQDNDKELKAAETATPEPPTDKAPDIDIHEAAKKGDIEAIKQHIAAGTDLNARGVREWTALHYAAL